MEEVSTVWMHMMGCTEAAVGVVRAKEGAAKL